MSEITDKLRTRAGIDAARELLSTSNAEITVRGKSTTVREECERLRSVGRMLERSELAGVPSTIAVRACVATGQRRTPAMEALDPLVTGSALTAVLAGPTGVGKSHAAARALAALGGHWIPAASLHDYRADEWGTLQRSDRLVVLDEVDLGHVAPRIGQIVCNRHDRGARTIVTANDIPGWWASIDPAGRLRSRCESAGVLWPTNDRRESRPERVTMRGELACIKDVQREAGLAVSAHWLWSESEAATPHQGYAAGVLMDTMGISPAEYLRRADAVQEAREAGVAMVAEAVARGLGQ